MARAKDNRYKTVTRLPNNAVKVSTYAQSMGWSNHTLVYNRLKRGKADYSIVVFQDINFVIPN